MTIVKNIKTGQEWTMEDEDAERIENSPHGQTFTFQKIKEPEELKDFRPSGSEAL